MVAGRALAALALAGLARRSASLPAGADVSGDGLLRRVSDKDSYKAYVYLPPGASPYDGKQWPLLIFLHGAGEAGDDLRITIAPAADGPMLNLSKGNGIPELAKRFVVAAPQQPRNERGFKTEKVVRFLDFMLTPEESGVKVDPLRLYVTGASNGGFSALLAASTGRFTAVASVAPAGTVAPLDVFHVPVWTFHGKNDVVVEPRTSRQLIRQLRDMGAEPDDARLTLYDEAPPPPGAAPGTQAGHGAALLAYRTPELFDWFLARRGSAGRGRDGLLRRIADKESYEAFLYVPAGQSAAPPAGWPLLVYLHGRPESGSDLELVRSPGAAGPVHKLSRGRCIPELSERFVVAAPQAPVEDKGWREGKVVRLLDFLLAESGLHLDRQRVYVTGSSMGGFGALVAASIGRFAAVAPVAVAGIVVPRDVQRVPVWAFHGRNDKIMPFKYSKDLIDGLLAAGADPDDARLTLYDDAPSPPGNQNDEGHGAALLVYRTPELFDWLLSHRLQQKPPLEEL